jgi:hypothetical protein
METARDFAQLQLHFVDRLQWRYELIRPIVLLQDRTPKQRAEETQTHLETVRELTRRFQKHGMLGLVPADIEMVPKGKATRVPQAVIDGSRTWGLRIMCRGFSQAVCAVSISRSTAPTIGFQPITSRACSASVHTSAIQS